MVGLVVLCNYNDHFCLLRILIVLFRFFLFNIYPYVHKFSILVLCNNSILLLYLFSQSFTYVFLYMYVILLFDCYTFITKIVLYIYIF